MRDREDEFVGRMLGHLALTDPKAPCMGAAAQAQTEYCGDRDYLAGRPSKRSAWYCCGNILEAALSHCITQAIRRSGCKALGPKCANCRIGRSCSNKAEMWWHFQSVRHGGAFRVMVRISLQACAPGQLGAFGM